MRLRANQVAEHFQHNALQPLYIVSGDEPLLVQETADLIRTSCRQCGMSEREIFHADSGFDWHNILEANNSMSLFGDRKLLEVRLSQAKFDDKAKKALQQYCENPNPDNALLMMLPKLDKKTLAAKWFQPIEKSAAIIQIWPVTLQQMPQWIQHRMRAAGLSPSTEATELLAERVEGNLLAAQQEIEKLALVMGKGPITEQDIEQSVADHARYSLYDMVDEAIQGHTSHAIKMLHQLQSSGAEPAVILWAFSKELRGLSAMSQLMANGLPVTKVLQQYRIWENRKPIIQEALRRTKLNTFRRCLLEAAHVDQAIKGIVKTNPWDGFTNMVLWLGGEVKAGQLGIR